MGEYLIFYVASPQNIRGNGELEYKLLVYVPTISELLYSLSHHLFSNLNGVVLMNLQRVITATLIRYDSWH